MSTPEDVALAALLHDVGKIRQRHSGQGDHQRLGVELLKEAFGGDEKKREELGLAVLAAGHHHKNHLSLREDRSDDLALPKNWIQKLAVVALADTLASAERRNVLDREEKAGGYRSYWTLHNPWHRIVNVFSEKPEPRWKWEKVRPEFLPDELPLLHFNREPKDFRPPKNVASVDTHHPKIKNDLKGRYRKLDRRLVELLRELGVSSHPYPFDPARVALEVTGSLVPAQHYIPEERDYMRAIPLYDHCTLTAAFAVCLQTLVDDGVIDPGSSDDPERSYSKILKEIKNGSHFLLVRGTLTGIGEFIRSVRKASPIEMGGRKRSYLKIIRGKSAAVDVITAGTAWATLLKTLGSKAHPALLIRAAGGSFILLLPAVDGAEESLKTLEESLKSTLLDLTDGVLSAGLAWIRFGSEEVFNRVRFQRKIMELEAKLSKSVERRPTDALGDAGRDLREVCPVCGKPTREDELESSGVCELCEYLHELGGTMVRRDEEGKPKLAGYMVMKHPRDERVEGIEVLRVKKHAYSAHYVEAENLPGAAGTGGLLLVDPAHIREALEAAGKKENTPRVMMTYIPWYAASKADVGEESDRSEVATFTGMAEAAPGANLLGLTYVDVDNLGAWMRIASRDSFGTMVALSRLADLTFRHWINVLGFKTAAQILNPPKIQLKGESTVDPTDNLPRFVEDGKLGTEHEDGNRPFLIAYSGGDDLIVVGAWNEALSLAHEAFLLFSHATGYTDLASISGATLLTRKKAPFHLVLAALKQAEKEAKKAGEGSPSEPRPMLEPKGMLKVPRVPEADPIPIPAVFLAIEEFRNIKDSSEALEKRTRVHKLLRALRTWWRSREEDDSALKTVSLLVYLVERIDDENKTLARTILRNIPLAPSPDPRENWKAPVGRIDVALIPYFLATKRG